mmetsp:Transcript_46689/g.107941  ORF Transcript_46689/g.107941 Transcript_46689/m.107941 type:complete len:271 (+) Transcript_46689:580-1392(+)
MRFLLEDLVVLDLRLVRQWPSCDLFPEKYLDEMLEDGDFVQLLGLQLVKLVEHVVLLVVVLCQGQIENVSSEGGLPTGLVSLHAGSVEDGQVALANVKVLLLVQPVPNHILIVLDLQILEVFLFQELGVQLLADDLCAYIVPLQEHQPHLVQDVLRLFPGLHGAEGLHLHLLQEVCGVLSASLSLLHLREHLRQPCALYFDKDLALGDIVERGDELKFLLFVKLIEPAHGQVHHVGDGAPQLPSLLRQHHNMFPEFGPLLGVEEELAYLA